jgi:hypothetical protein
MRKTLLLTAILTVSALWLHAQEGNPGKDSPAAGANNGRQVTMQGCLHAAGGQYTIRDDHGINHRLSGDTAKLKEYQGHEVHLTGTYATRTADTTMEGAASSATERLVFRVHDVANVSDTCNGH